MKRFGTKRLMTAVLGVVTAAMLSTSVLAAYVPTVISRVESGKVLAKETMSFKKNGNVTNDTSFWSMPDPSYKTSTTYKWKGNLLSGIHDEYGPAVSYKYKNGILKSTTEDGDTITFTWKKKTAAITLSDGSVSGSILKRNSKKKRASVSYDYGLTISYKYYGNGNLKSVTNTSSDGKDVFKFNKAGYITSCVVTEGGSTRKTSFKYKMDKKKKCPKSVTVTEYDGSKSFYTFSKFKKVKQSKNCDAWGHFIPLGINDLYIGE